MGLFGIKGLSFSWRRALGITAIKQRIARKTGIPLTQKGRHEKLGRTIAKFFAGLWPFGNKKQKSSTPPSAEDKAKREYLCLKNIAEGKPANLADLQDPSYVTRPQIVVDIAAVPEVYTPKLTPAGLKKLQEYEAAL